MNITITYTGRNLGLTLQLARYYADSREQATWGRKMAKAYPGNRSFYRSYTSKNSRDARSWMRKLVAIAAGKLPASQVAA